MKDIVPSLFGITPEMYDQSQQARIDQQATQLAQLDPFQRATFGVSRGANMLAGALGQSLGREDPERLRIIQQQQLMQEIDPSDPTSLLKGAQKANSLGLAQFSLNLVDRAQALQESQAKISKAMEPPKLTGEERYMNILQNVEGIYQSGKEPTPAQKSAANMAAQLLSKPRTYLDAASGQMITQAPTDPSKAYPLTFKAMGVSTEGGATTVPKPTVFQATTGNLPAASQRDIADIESSLVRLENTSPQLDTFANLLKSGEVKFNAASNAFDFLGAVIPPIFGGQEVGNQVKKDDFTRAFTERVNYVLNNAKGVQARDDADRAKQQIASPSTFLSSARMQGAIDYLKKAESGYKEELLARRNSLQRQGKPETQETTSAPPSVAQQPTAQAPVTQPTQKPAQAPNQMTREQMIEAVIRHNANKGVIVTPQQAEKALRDAKKL